MTRAPVLFPGAAPKATFGSILREKGNDCIGSRWVSALFDRLLAHRDRSG